MRGVVKRCRNSIPTQLTKEKNALHYLHYLHYGGESAESAESARQKNESAIFYTTGMACRAMDERRKGGIQSRGTTKKEEPKKEEPEKKNLRKKNLRKKKLPARIVEQAGVPIDRVIGLSGYRENES